ncbi:cytochrome P450 [Kitasatospora purpeofusca]|uniref:cytochrome P450 n=1 Tax=Kitasatospora purpeofusca TaxID=67352 RepID=UPI003800FF4F
MDGTVGRPHEPLPYHAPAPPRTRRARSPAGTRVSPAPRSRRAPPAVARRCRQARSWLGFRGGTPHRPGGLRRTRSRTGPRPARPGPGTIRAGEAVVPSHAHAGRDPAVFVRPDDFDITRPPGPHLAFGHGPHRCIGADLALLELRTAIGALADRAPHLRLAEPATALPFLGGSLIGGVERLPVRTHAP